MQSTQDIGEDLVIDGRYRLGREIARGGMSVVYQAEHLHTGRRVALKLLTPEGARNPDLRDRLMREARALTLARHRSVVDVLDAGARDDEPAYLVMEMLEGRGLDGILAARKRLRPADAVFIGIALCEALSHAHERGLVHRDVKPGNVIITRDEAGGEHLKLIDFGIAALRDERRVELPRKITRRDSLLGTPEYMSLEQLALDPNIGHRSDIYSIGVTVYECLTGSVPFSGSYAEVLLAASAGPPPSVREAVPELPQALADAVARALERDPTRRFPVARAFARALARSVGEVPRSASLLGAVVDLAHANLLRSDTDEVRAEARAKELAPLPPPTPEAPPRAFRRAPYVTPLRLTGSDGTVVTGRTEDISEGGALILVTTAPWADDVATVSFAPPGMMVTRLPVKVCWVRNGRGGVAVGLEFRSLPDAVRQAIHTHVTSPPDEAQFASRAVSGEIQG